MQVKVIGGVGRWAYWSNQEQGEVVADAICNQLQPNFAGQLGEIWKDTKPGFCELHESGFVAERPKSIFDIEGDE